MSREKLDWPTGNDDVFTFGSTATIAKVVEDRLQTYQSWPGLGVEFNENNYVQRSHRFQIKGCSNSTADRIALDNTVGLHTVDCFDDFFYAHVPRMSVKSFGRKREKKNKLGIKNTR